MCGYTEGIQRSTEEGGGCRRGVVMEEICGYTGGVRLYRRCAVCYRGGICSCKWCVVRRRGLIQEMRRYTGSMLVVGKCYPDFWEGLEDLLFWVSVNQWAEF